MNAGFSSLTLLKAQLLAASVRNNTQYDDIILSIGRGVAKQFEHTCNRKFARVVGDKEIFQADRASFILGRSPIEQITGIERQLTAAEGWETLDLSLIQSFNPESGVVYLKDGTDAGPYYSQIRFTYTGGFWWDDSEEGNGICPAGAADLALLHADFILGWQLQCKHIWRKTDRLGVGISQDPEKQDSEKHMVILPMVLDLIDDMTRHQLT